VPWEPDHRCRGKGQKHIIEVHYDSDDEDLEQSDDVSDSCTEANDSSTLEKDDDPCIVDRHSGGPDDSTNTSTGISHTIDDLTPQ
jgi:hypothetical protein